VSKVVIIGNGISGITAARHIRKKSDDEIVVISEESEYFFSRTALMYVYMGHMRWQDIEPYEPAFYSKNRIQLVFGRVKSVDFEKRLVHLSSGNPQNFDQLILATGSKPAKFGWPGQDLPGVQGLYSKQDLELLEKNSEGVRRAVIIGGGLIGIELAEMLVSRGIEVSYLVREDKFFGNVLSQKDAGLVTRHIKEHHIDLRINTQLKEVLSGSDGRVNAILTDQGEKIECQLVGLTTGVTPNIEFLKNTSLETKRGILINEYLETNIFGVYAIGDCAEMKTPLVGRKAVEQVWYTGRIMGETVAATICGKRTAYQPGPWFNSAKFFDIEYQTYGNVSSVQAENEERFFWEHEAGKIAVHLVWEKSSGRVIGINAFGLRLRHEVFDHWLRNKADVKSVMQHLTSANFDPEFYRRHETAIIAAFNKTFGLEIKPASKSWWQKILRA